MHFSADVAVRLSGGSGSVPRRANPATLPCPLHSHSMAYADAEMSFFTRWWKQQDDNTRALVTRLIEEGQLEFVNGGYVQVHSSAGWWMLGGAAFAGGRAGRKAVVTGRQQLRGGIILPC